MKSITCLILVATLGVTACDNRRPDETEAKPDLGEGAQIASVYERIASDTMDLMKEAEGASLSLGQVSDVEAAKSAAAKLADIGRRFEELAEELAPLDPPSDEIRARISEKFEAQAGKTLQVVAGGVEGGDNFDEMDSETLKIVQEAKAEFFTTLGEVGEEFNRHFKPKSTPPESGQTPARRHPESE